MKLDRRPVVGIFRAPMFNQSERFVQAQAASLDRYQPLMIGLDDKGNVIPELDGRVLVLSSLGSQMSLKVLGRPGRLPDALRMAAPVLIHAHFATDGLTAMPIAQRLGIPLVTTLRGYDVNVRPRNLLTSGRLSWMRYALFGGRLRQGGNLFLAVSDALRHQAVARGFPADRTLTHYNGVNLDRIKSVRGAERDKLVLHVGRLVEKKGTRVLLQAFASLLPEHPDAELAIIGEGPLGPELRTLAQTLGVGSAVRFLGVQTHAETLAWMQRCWVLAAPSVTAPNGDAEGLPNVVVEAAASGLPVVGSDHAGIPEAIDEGSTGFIVPESDASALSIRLAAVLGSAQLRDEMGGRARALAEERFDHQRQAQRLEDHYDRLLLRHRNVTV